MTKQNARKKKSKINKKPASTKSEASVTCGFCARLVEDGSAIPCVCTRVVFCSTTCQQQATDTKSHDCLGPPDQSVNIGQQLRKLRTMDTSLFKNPEYCQSFAEENARTVRQPMIEILLQDREFLFENREMTVERFQKYADQGHPCFAYLAGIHYKNRLLGKIKENRREQFVADNSNHNQVGVLTTNELAFKYLEQGAKAGHGLSMLSLAECYEMGIGTRTSLRECQEWLWRAVLQNSAGSMAMLDSKALLPLEMNANIDMIDQVEERLLPGQKCNLGGPNLGALLIALLARKTDHTLPPFRATSPTLQVGAEPSPGTTCQITIIGSKEMEKINSKVARSDRRFIEASFVYGRRGSSKAATESVYCDAVRSLDSNLFVVPPFAACDETLSDDDVTNWLRKASARSYYGEPLGLEVNCIHSEKSGGTTTKCPECIHDARERLAVASKSSVVISLEERLLARGQTAIWRQPDGTLKSETFKNYSRGEVECVLAALVASEEYRAADVAHPLFVAQDPNFFWILILYHGCIRAALEYVAPHVDWNARLGPAKPALEREPIIAMKNRTIKPGDILIKCGNDVCLKLEPEKCSGSFKVCGRCQRRSYCSQQCAKADWMLHKRECTAASSGRKPEAQKSLPDDNQATQSLPPIEPQVGEKVVIHGLVGKPEYNGRVGEITSDIQDGRYHVRLSNQATKLAIKSANFTRLSAVAKKGRKATKFECRDHGAEVCRTCKLDFTIVNHLLKLQSATLEPWCRQQIGIVVENHYATIERTQDEVSVHLNQDHPIAYQGIDEANKLFMVKSLLKSNDKSIPVLGTLAGFACYSARLLIPARAYIIDPVEEVLTEIGRSDS